ncbi:substrate-binding domain-containing protein [Hoyosella altamirensis]|uniref:Simple sugar transport system substrate-binding protein n=1 Tax=Hoyosella altamirensis TaxID=616997 RepID=A0A839RS97_9ACTN|nr:substrate-binding domain-containing protein [Hoyosella altamirensis]MBB3039735.1 simple sugar transport system substrate-binding protein [Hoyosella altamirensis]
MTSHPQRENRRDSAARPPRTCRRWLGAVAGLTLIAVTAACSSTGGRPEATGGGIGAGQADTDPITIAMITHAAPGDTFWDLIRAGAETAAAKNNATLRYSSDPQAPNQANFVQGALDAGVDGIALTLAFPDALSGAVQQAANSGVPLVAFNAGLDDWERLGVDQYFGQDENVAGAAVGDRLNEEGSQNAICVIMEQGNVALESRCAGVASTFGGNVEVLNVEGRNMPGVRSAIDAKLRQDPNIDTVITLGAPFALTAVDAITDANSEARVVTFDTNAALMDAIEAGAVEWAIDQQPFLQGYLAVDSLWLNIYNDTVIGGGQSVLTGPTFIDESNIESIADLARSGLR